MRFVKPFGLVPQSSTAEDADCPKDLDRFPLDRSPCRLCLKLAFSIFCRSTLTVLISFCFKDLIGQVTLSSVWLAVLFPFKDGKVGFCPGREISTGSPPVPLPPPLF